MVKTFYIYCLLFSFLCFTACQKDFEFASEDLQRLGTSARHLLSAEKYTTLKVEVAYTPGLEPDAQNIQLLRTFLNTYLNKPAGIQVKLTPIKSGGKNRLSIADMVLIEKKNRSVFTQGSTITVFIMLTDTPFAEEEVLATSYWNTSFAIFGPSVQESSGRSGQVSKSKLISTLLQHEFGHLLGLVGQGSPMQQEHRDHDNGAHCSNRSCLMYYDIETAENIGATTPIPVLDALCMADLKANGGK